MAGVTNKVSLIRHKNKEKRSKKRRKSKEKLHLQNRIESVKDVCSQGRHDS